MEDMGEFIPDQALWAGPVVAALPPRLAAVAGELMQRAMP